MTDSPQPQRRNLHRLLAVAIGLLVALVLAELLLRVLGPGGLPPREADYPVEVIRDDSGLMGLTPGGTVVYQWAGDPYGTLPEGARMACPINRHGLRGAPADARRPRLLVVGDSFTFGEGVALADTFVARLEERIAQATSPPVQCVDAGIPGYGTVDQALRLPLWLVEFQPRAVLLVFTPNDPIPFAESEARGRDFMNQAGDAAGLRLLQLVRRAGLDAQTVEWYRSYYSGERRDAWKSASAQIATMVEACRSRGIPFGVAAFPLLHDLRDDPLAEVHDQLAGLCVALGVPLLDLTPALQRYEMRELWVHPTDHHPNARAHAAVAAELAPFVETLLR